MDAIMLKDSGRKAAERESEMIIVEDRASGDYKFTSPDRTRFISPEIIRNKISSERKTISP
jgi:hypothetical protein